MNAKLDQAYKALAQLSPERQEELADLLLLATQQPTTTHNAEQLAAIDEGIADADTSNFASEEEVSALFTRFRAV